MESKMKYDNEAELTCQKNHFKGLYLRNLGASLFGFCIVMILNVFTPLGFFKIQRAFIFTEGGWTGFFLFFPVVIILVILLQFQVQRPVSNFLTLINKKKEIPDDLQEKAKQRLLNLPFFIAIHNLAIYIFVSAVITLTFYLFRDIHPRICLFLFFRVFMIGLIAASLSFFLVEDYSRRTLIPLYFPQGRLATLPGTIKIPILRRIRLLNIHIGCKRNHRNRSKVTQDPSLYIRF